MNSFSPVEELLCTCKAGGAQRGSELRKRRQSRPAVAGHKFSHFKSPLRTSGSPKKRKPTKGPHIRAMFCVIRYRPSATWRRAAVVVCVM